MNELPVSRKVQILTALVEGCSIRATSRMTGTHKTTIMRLLCETGDKCIALLDETMRDLPCRHVQVDEIWTFVRKKQCVLTVQERDNPELGDQYVFVPLDAYTNSW